MANASACPAAGPGRCGRCYVRFLPPVLLVAAAAVGVLVFRSDRPSVEPDPFVRLRHPDPAVADTGFAEIEVGWDAASPFQCLEVSPFLTHHGHREKLFSLLRAKTGQPFADAPNEDWYHWLWEQPAPDPAAAAAFRVRLYDHAWFYALADYFRNNPPTAIRADEIRYGGVTRDGIPPIRGPRMVPATDPAAAYLADADAVFGVRINGDARAYPRRVLGHHEMVCDTVGGEPVTGVYCTLCEAMIVYRNRTADGTAHAFGTSGFLYRSNKLMYDAGTLSLWSTLDGEPVVGKLVGKGLKLKSYPVVTTTWKEWKAAHPATTVVSLKDVPVIDFDGPPTDYREGAAYRDYYATDRLMFPVRGRDGRLANKAEVFVPRVDGADPVAFSIAFLAANPVHAATVGGTGLVIVTTPGGANRAYEARGKAFEKVLDGGRVKDAAGVLWSVEEEALRSPAGEALPRVPGHRAFWFGWHAANPAGTLVK